MFGWHDSAGFEKGFPLGVPTFVANTSASEMNDGVKPFQTAFENLACLVVPFDTSVVTCVGREGCLGANKASDLVPCCLQKSAKLHADEAG